MKIKDVNIRWIEEELEQLKTRPVCYDTLEWYEVLLSLKHRMEKEDGMWMREKHRVSGRDMLEAHHGKMDRKDAEKIVAKFECEDGRRGGKWSFEQTESVRTKEGIHCDPVAFFLVMNSLYSDYDHVLKEHNVSTVELYAEMAEAWLEDRDAKEDKVEIYFRNVPK